MPGGKQDDPIAETVAALEHIPAGPTLAAALASLDLTVLTGSQVMDAVKALYRQDSHGRAQLFAGLAEAVHRSEADSAAFEQWPDEFAPDELRAALVLTRQAASNLCLFAEDVVRRLPAVHQDFTAGLLDQPRVRVFSIWTSALSDEHTDAIVAALLPRAAGLTTAQLIHQIQRHAIALDPTWARRRYENALAGRRVVGTRNSDGTANLTGYDLPADQVAAACDRLDRLARAAKQAGHPDPIDHIRAGLFLAMTDGSYEGLTDPQILAHLLAQTKPTKPSTPTPDQPPTDHRAADHQSAGDPAADHQSADDPAADHSSAGAPSDDVSADRQPADDPFAGDGQPSDGKLGDGKAADGQLGDGQLGDGQPGDGQPGDGQPGDGQPGDGQPGEGQPGNGAGDAVGGERSADGSSTQDRSADDRHADPPSPAGGGGPGQADGDGRTDTDTDTRVGRPTLTGLRLLVRLATVVGADAKPGELIGWGPVHAELARTIAAAPGASWWFVLTGSHGTPLSIGRVRSRPADAAPRGRGYTGPELWLQVNQANLNALAEQTHPPGWDEVLAEITVKAETCPGPPNGDPRSRLPGAALRRWIAVRDRSCSFPGCRVPAHRADADHSIEHANGGPTTDINIGPACRHDHRLRHEGGWTLTHTQPGHFTWTSRLGHTYHRLPPPDLDDLPDPMPAPAGEENAYAGDEYSYPSTQDWRNDSCMEPEPPPPPAPPPPPPPAPPEDDPPPF